VTKFSLGKNKNLSSIFIAHNSKKIDRFKENASISGRIEKEKSDKI